LLSIAVSFNQRSYSNKCICFVLAMGTLVLTVALLTFRLLWQPGDEKSNVACQACGFSSRLQYSSAYSYHLRSLNIQSLLSTPSVCLSIESYLRENCPSKEHSTGHTRLQASLLHLSSTVGFNTALGYNKPIIEPPFLVCMVTK
jgi:hypothetical protein